MARGEGEAGSHMTSRSLIREQGNGCHCPVCTETSGLGLSVGLRWVCCVLSEPSRCLGDNQIGEARAQESGLDGSSGEHCIGGEM